MSTKPNTLPEWSSDQSNMTAPSSGQKQTGWTPNQDGVSDYDNWKSYWTYKWCEYVNDGVYSGLITFSGGVAYTGVTDYSLTADQTALNPGTIANTRVINITADTDFTWLVSGIVAGTTGQELVVINTGSNSFFIESEDTGATAANRIVFPSSATAYDGNILVKAGGAITLRYSASRWRVVHLSGCYNYTQVVIPAAAAQYNRANDTTFGATGGYNLDYGSTIGNARLHFPVVLPLGFLINDWDVHVNKISDTGTTITVSLETRAFNSGSTVSITSGSLATNAPGYTSVGPGAPTEHTVASGVQYVIVVNSTAADSDKDQIIDATIEGWSPF